MTASRSQTDTEIATAIVRESLSSNLTVLSVQPLHGGMVNTVEKWFTDGHPAALVAKVSPQPNNKDLLAEFESLKWYRRNTSFPVPEPYVCSTVTGTFDGTCLLMEAIEGRNLGTARVSYSGSKKLQKQLAHILVELHGHTRETYGSALEPAGPARWLDIFEPMIRSNYDKCKSHLSSPARASIEKMLSQIETWLGESNRPTLVHGDIWATNIMVDDRDPDNPTICAFLDSHASYCEVEYELAYLRVFNTADEIFFAEYCKRYPLRGDFDKRCLVYWLNTMMLHVWKFGDTYTPSTESLAKRIRMLS